MIGKQTALDIWKAYQEIEVGEDLLKTLEEASARSEPPDLRDHFGRPRGLQLGVPSGDNGHRLFDVHPSLAKAVIRAHIASKQAELQALNVQAWNEAEGAASGGPA